MSLSLPNLIPAANLGTQVFPYVWDRSPVNGQGGWRYTNGPSTFDAVPTPSVVHDILEHFEEGAGDVHWELMALGAAHWIRHDGGYFREKKARISQGLVEPAFGSLFYHIKQDVLTTLPAPFSAEACMPLDRFTTDLEIQRTIMAAREFGRGQGYNRDLIDDCLKHALGWMRIGYRRAVERYHTLTQLDAKDVSRLFLRVEKRIDRETNAVYQKANGAWQGKMELQLDPAQGTFWVKVQ